MSERQRERATKQEADGHAGSSSAAAPRGVRVERALARTSDAPLREGNKLALLKNGPDTYEDWLAAIGRSTTGSVAWTCRVRSGEASGKPA
jgi:hypothetical protein